jgi:hypothetical protein
MKAASKALGKMRIRTGDMALPDPVATGIDEVQAIGDSLVVSLSATNFPNERLVLPTFAVNA